MDIRLIHSPTVAGEVGIFDIGYRLGDLDQRDELTTAIIMSLFCDRRANDDDPLPVDGESRRGWWGDDYFEVEGYKIGSRLWLLQREKQTDETLTRAKEYVNESIAWMIEDGIAEKVVPTVEWVAMGVLGIQLEVYRPNGDQVLCRYDYLWQQVAGEVPPTLAEIAASAEVVYLTSEDDETLLTEDDVELLA